MYAQGTVTLETAHSSARGLSTAGIVSCRHLLNKNSRFWIDFENKKGHIEKEFQFNSSKLDGNRKIMRSQLRRYHSDRLAYNPRMTARTDKQAQDQVTDTASSAIGIIGNDYDEEDVINPYPITIMSTNATGTKGLTSYVLSKSRGSRRLPIITSSKITGGNTVGRSTSLCSLRNSPSARRHSACALGDGADPDDKEFWVGSPEAISSVRRPRKTIAEQRHQRSQREWKRAVTLKDSPKRKVSDSLALPGHASTSVNRSHSLKVEGEYQRFGTYHCRGNVSGETSRSSSNSNVTEGLYDVSCVAGKETGEYTVQRANRLSASYSDVDLNDDTGSHKDVSILSWVEKIETGDTTSHGATTDDMSHGEKTILPAYSKTFTEKSVGLLLQNLTLDGDLVGSSGGSPSPSPLSGERYFNLRVDPSKLSPTVTKFPPLHKSGSYSSVNELSTEDITTCVEKYREQL